METLSKILGGLFLFLILGIVIIGIIPLLILGLIIVAAITVLVGILYGIDYLFNSNNDEEKPETDDEIIINNVADVFNSNEYDITFNVKGKMDEPDSGIMLVSNDMKYTYSNVFPNVKINNGTVKFVFTKDEGNTIIEKERSISENDWSHVRLLKRNNKLRVLVNRTEIYTHRLPDYTIPGSFLRIKGDNIKDIKI